jgi:hypothetical protein
MNALILTALLAASPAELTPPPPPPQTDQTELSPPPPPPAPREVYTSTNAQPPEAAPVVAPPETSQRGATLDLDRERPTTATLSFSPLSTFALGVVLEGEFRVNEHLTTYLAGEFYGAWMGFGAQIGLRIYPSQAFRGFFIDLHGRAQDLYLNHLIGGGLEIGSQHQLGRSHWSILWSVGADVGAGSWNQYHRSPTDLPSWLSEGVTAAPKLRLMLAYNF